MKVIVIETQDREFDLVIDQIAYLVKCTEPTVSFSAVMIDSTSVPLTESQFNEAKTYLLQ